MKPTIDLLTDHGVLQRDAAIPLRGTAAPGAAVRLSFRGREWKSGVDPAGRWQAVIGPFESGGPDDLAVAASGGDARAVRDLLVGDVWVCSGQSNMAMPLRDAEGGGEEAAGACDPALRLLPVSRCSADAAQPALAAGSQWVRCDPAAAAAFSAIGYFFGRALRAALGVPIGLIDASVGNTPGEAWMPRAAIDADAGYGPILQRWERSLAIAPDPDRLYARAFEVWDAMADRFEREGRRIPGAHPKLVGPGHVWTPAGLWNGMIAPLTALPVRGVIWYQGAGAPERAHQYRRLFRALIRSWRAAWGIGDFPFLYLQEANFGPRRDQPAEHSWAELREAQQMALAEPNTAMGVAMDVGEERNIHPVRKRPLGERLALAAQARVYGQDIPWSSPFLREMATAGASVRLRFDHTYGGLRTSDGREPAGFALSGGYDGKSAGSRGFAWARGRIEGDEIVLHSPAVPEPTAVRYAWAQNPDCNVVNAIGLPLAPFRTDDWPGVTVGNE